jgi:hypothetical protein
MCYVSWNKQFVEMLSVSPDADAEKQKQKHFVAK